MYVKRKATKGELVAGRATKGELRSQGSRASGRLRERSGQGVPEAPVDGIKEQVKSDVLKEGTIEGVTKRHRMKVEQRKELSTICTHCGQQFSRPQDLNLTKIWTWTWTYVCTYVHTYVCMSVCM